MCYRFPGSNKNINVTKKIIIFNLIKTAIKNKFLAPNKNKSFTKKKIIKLSVKNFCF